MGNKKTKLLLFVFFQVTPTTFSFLRDASLKKIVLRRLSIFCHSTFLAFWIFSSLPVAPESLQSMLFTERDK